MCARVGVAACPAPSLAGAGTTRRRWRAFGATTSPGAISNRRRRARRAEGTMPGVAGRGTRCCNFRRAPALQATAALSEKPSRRVGSSRPGTDHVRAAGARSRGTARSPRRGAGPPRRIVGGRIHLARIHQPSSRAGEDAGLLRGHARHEDGTHRLQRLARPHRQGRYRAIPAGHDSGSGQRRAIAPPGSSTGS